MRDDVLVELAERVAVHGMYLLQAHMRFSVSICTFVLVTQVK
jgi:hypothetical protein